MPFHQTSWSFPFHYRPVHAAPLILFAWVPICWKQNFSASQRAAGEVEEVPFHNLCTAWHRIPILSLECTLQPLLYANKGPWIQVALPHVLLWTASPSGTTVPNAPGWIPDGPLNILRSQKGQHAECCNDIRGDYAYANWAFLYTHIHKIPKIIRTYRGTLCRAPQ